METADGGLPGPSVECVNHKLSSDSPDIRKQVEASRGPLKKLELLVPGLRGYRELEDVRVSDEMLRNQVGDRLDRAKSNLESLRQQMASGGDFTNLSAVGSLVSRVQQLAGEVRHAQQGYSGFVAAVKVDQSTLNRLYDYDYDFVRSAMDLQDAASKVVFDPATPGSVQGALSSVASLVETFKQKWTARTEAVEGILVK